MIDFKKFVARLRLRYSMGVGFVGMFTSAIGILTFAKVWEGTFIYYRIPTIIVYVVLPVGFFIVCWLVGYIYDIKGIWKEETSHVNVNLNPEFVIICESVETVNIKIDDIIRRLEKLDDKLKS